MTTLVSRQSGLFTFLISHNKSEAASVDCFDCIRRWLVAVTPIINTDIGCKDRVTAGTKVSHLKVFLLYTFNKVDLLLLALHQL